MLKSINVAMHNTHCSHAASALLNLTADTYFGFARNELTRTKDETSKTMNLIRNYRNWRRYRETVSELGRLSTRELSDIGMSRGDIPYIARKAI